MTALQSNRVKSPVFTVWDYIRLTWRNLRDAAFDVCAPDHRGYGWERCPWDD